MPLIETDDGITIHYQTEGSAAKPPLILSNSLGTNLSMWDGQAEVLASRFHLIRYDTRGHGRSHVPEGPYELDRLGRDVLNLLDALEIHKVTWCGLSLGGMLGMWMGIHAPDRIDRLVLCNTAAVMPPPSMWDERIETVLGDGMGAIADGVLDRWFTTPFRVCSQDQVRRVGDMLLATSPVGYAGCCAAIRDMDQRSALEAIHQEVLIVAGRDDPATPVARAEEIKRHVPQARLVVLDQCAHLSNIEQREAFNRAILPFVSGSLERQADRRW